ncbi:Txe/YoeB family addiction module toxin [Deinococcus sp. Arct2-2]|uniref:Txe/YoeB family addiction module toxin n=1 Tax=Deinococcus sp. Arct2-2 TaxID=2568653 RepID=UPI0010A41B31|nr:Txe/YoeB family addiction module toxin [Deinococcus sp. Arct2-2]THF69781.1 Txe/YoeB family addiction module toxin [Deinococcus sp. Arct2-2]
MNLTFTPKGWADYLLPKSNEPKLVRKLHRLLDECIRTPFEGSGKPEALKYELTGFWSRRITDEHRLVYAIDDDAITVISCRLHYEL